MFVPTMVYIDSKRSSVNFPGGNHMYGLTRTTDVGWWLALTRLLGHEEMRSSVMGPRNWKLYLRSIGCRSAVRQVTSLVGRRQ